MGKEYKGWLMPRDIFVESTSLKRRSPQAIDKVIEELCKKLGLSTADSAKRNPETRRAIGKKMLPATLTLMPNGKFHIACRDISSSGMTDREHLTVVLLEDNIDYVDVYVGEDDEGLFFESPTMKKHFGRDYQGGLRKVVSILDEHHEYILKMHSNLKYVKDTSVCNRLSQFIQLVNFVAPLTPKERRRYDL